MYVGTINSKPPGRIITIHQSEILNRSQVQFSTLFSRGAQLCCAIYQPQQAARIAISWAKPAHFDFFAINLTVCSHILSTGGDALIARFGYIFPKDDQQFFLHLDSSYGWLPIKLHNKIFLKKKMYLNYYVQKVLCPTWKYNHWCSYFITFMVNNFTLMFPSVTYKFKK
jgi:hypothetical protein